MNTLRIWRSSHSDFYKDEALHAAAVYTPDCLREIAGAGFNAIWIRGILRDLVRTSEPELLAYKNFGETSLREIKEMLSIKGLHLGQGAEDIGEHIPFAPQAFPLQRNIPDLF